MPAGLERSVNFTKQEKTAGIPMSYTHNDGFDRSANGQFSFTDVGADSFEQSIAGVNTGDSRVDAQRKISEFRHAELQNQRAESEAGYGGGYVPERPSMAGRALLILIFFIGTGIGLLSIPNYLKYTWPHDDVYAKGDPKYRSESQAEFKIRQAQYLQFKQHVTGVFRPDAPMSSIFTGCKKPCAGPDLAAFASFRKHAVNAELAVYENTICRKYFDAGSTTRHGNLNAEARYKFDIKEGTCVLANVDEIKALLRSRNTNPIVVYWKHTVWFFAFLLSAFLFKKLWRQHDRELIKSGWAR